MLTLYIANKSLTHEECIAAGCDPDNGPYDGAQMDAIVEVDMEMECQQCLNAFLPNIG